MRYYALDDYLRAVSAATGVPMSALPDRMVDLDAAIAALKEGGGLPSEADDRLDAARKAARLLSSLVRLHPVLFGLNGEIALRATRQYLEARGQRLCFKNTQAASVLVDQIEDDRLTLEDLRRVLLNSMSPLDPHRSGEHGAGPPLKPVTLYISLSADPAGGSTAQAASEVAGELDRRLRSLGARVQPSLQHRQRARGAQAAARRSDNGGPAEVGTVFSRRLGLLSTSDGLVIVDDGSGPAAAIETEFAQRLAMPLFTLLPDGAGPQRADIDGWQVILAAITDDAKDTAIRVLPTIRRHAPLLHDYAAYRRAVELKNAVALARLKGSWRALDRRQRAAAIQISRLSAGRIDSYLLNGVCLELASCRERRDLDLALLSPPPPGRGVHEFSRTERRLLAEAGAELGLTGAMLLDTAADVAVRMSQPLARWRMRTVDDARAAILQALEAEGGETT